jgi:hypothetical protein
MASNSTLVDRRPSIIALNDIPIDTTTTDDHYPVWLNENFMEKTMCDYYQDPSIKVKRADVKYAVGKGENYASILYRVRVSYHTKNNVSFFCKIEYYKIHFSKTYSASAERTNHKLHNQSHV